MAIKSSYRKYQGGDKSIDAKKELLSKARVLSKEELNQISKETQLAMADSTSGVKSVNNGDKRIIYQDGQFLELPRNMDLSALYPTDTTIKKKVSNVGNNSVVTATTIGLDTSTGRMVTKPLNIDALNIETQKEKKQLDPTKQVGANKTNDQISLGLETAETLLGGKEDVKNVTTRKGPISPASSKEGWKIPHTKKTVITPTYQSAIEKGIKYFKPLAKVGKYIPFAGQALSAASAGFELKQSYDERLAKLKELAIYKYNNGKHDVHGKELNQEQFNDYIKNFDYSVGDHAEYMTTDLDGLIESATIATNFVPIPYADKIVKHSGKYLKDKLKNLDWVKKASDSELGKKAKESVKNIPSTLKDNWKGIAVGTGVGGYIASQNIDGTKVKEKLSEYYPTGDRQNALNRMEENDNANSEISAEQLARMGMTAKQYYDKFVGGKRRQVKNRTKTIEKTEYFPYHKKGGTIPTYQAAGTMKFNGKDVSFSDITKAPVKSLGEIPDADWFKFLQTNNAKAGYDSYLGTTDYYKTDPKNSNKQFTAGNKKVSLDAVGKDKYRSGYFTSTNVPVPTTTSAVATTTAPIPALLNQTMGAAPTTTAGGQPTNNTTAATGATTPTTTTTANGNTATTPATTSKIPFTYDMESTRKGASFKPNGMEQELASNRLAMLLAPKPPAIKFPFYKSSKYDATYTGMGLDDADRIAYKSLNEQKIRPGGADAFSNASILNQFKIGQDQSRQQLHAAVSSKLGQQKNQIVGSVREANAINYDRANAVSDANTEIGIKNAFAHADAARTTLQDWYDSFEQMRDNARVRDVEGFDNFSKQQSSALQNEYSQVAKSMRDLVASNPNYASTDEYRHMEERLSLIGREMEGLNYGRSDVWSGKGYTTPDRNYSGSRIPSRGLTTPKTRPTLKPVPQIGTPAGDVLKQDAAKLKIQKPTTGDFSIDGLNKTPQAGPINTGILPSLQVTPSTKGGIMDGIKKLFGKDLAPLIGTFKSGGTMSFEEKQQLEYEKMLYKDYLSGKKGSKKIKSKYGKQNQSSRKAYAFDVPKPRQTSALRQRQ